MSFISKLQTGVYQITGKLYANWTPQDPLSLGDIGQISGSRFIKDFNIKDRGFNYVEKLDRQVGSSEFKNEVIIDVDSSIAATSQGAGLGKGNAQVRMKFGCEGAFVYHLADLTYSRFTDRQRLIGDLGKAILSNQLRWLETYVLIDEIRKAERASVIVSDSANADLTFDCTVDTKEEGFLAKVGADFGANIKSTQVIYFLGLKDHALFYHPVQLQFDDGGGPGPVTAALAKVRELFMGKPIAPESIKMVEYLDESNRWLANYSINDAGNITMIGLWVELDDFISRELEASEEGSLEEIETVKIEKKRQAVA